MGRIEQVIKRIFSSEKAIGHAGELLDSQSMSVEGKRQLVERLTRDSLLGRSCHVCGETFSEQDVSSAIFLGPIGEDGRCADAHDICFREALERHHEASALVGTKMTNWSEQDHLLWSNAFSDMPANGLFNQLFGKRGSE